MSIHIELGDNAINWIMLTLLIVFFVYQWNKTKKATHVKRKGS